MTVLTLLGGLGLFLYGMHAMGEGLGQIAGSRMKNLLAALTRNRFLGVIMGAAVTAVIQSSSATTVMVVGFVNAGLLTLGQTIGVIMGANIGTTVTSLMLSIELDFGMLFAAIGAVCTLLSHRPKVKVIGQITMGLGILFVGMDTMSAAMKPLRDWPGFVEMMTIASNPLIGVLVGAGVTAILQSSSASVGILQALAGTGAISLHAAMFILFGQNIGTCVTALIASVGASKTAKRAAVIHLLFNILGSVIFIIIAICLPLDIWVSNIAGDNIRLQISITHIIFNISTTIMLFPFASIMEKITYIVVRGKDPQLEEKHMHFFDERMFQTPAIAARQLFAEVQRMAEMVRKNYIFAVQYLNKPTKMKVEEFNNREEVIDYLNNEITHNLIELRALNLNSEDVHLAGSLFHVVNDLERIGDHCTNIVEIAAQRQEQKIKFSNKADGELHEIIECVEKMMDCGCNIFKNQSTDVHEINEVLLLEEKVDTFCEQYAENHVERLKNKKCTPHNGMLYLDLLNNLERIGDHVNNISTSVDRGDSPTLLW